MDNFKKNKIRRVMFAACLSVALLSVHWISADPASGTLVQSSVATDAVGVIITAAGLTIITFLLISALAYLATWCMNARNYSARQ